MIASESSSQNYGIVPETKDMNGEPPGELKVLVVADVPCVWDRNICLTALPSSLRADNDW